MPLTDYAHVIEMFMTRYVKFSRYLLRNKFEVIESNLVYNLQKLVITLFCERIRIMYRVQEEERNNFYFHPSTPEINFTIL